MIHNMLGSQKRIFVTLLMALTVLASVSAQQIQVTGVVRDATTGEALFGVNIQEKNTTTGTISDMNGNYSLSVASNAVLVFRYVGYQTVEVPVAGRRIINLTLEEDAVALSEFLVIGYGTVRRNDATGSLTAIKPDALNKGLTTNAQDMLMGKVAGMTVTSHGGTPGGGATIRIRGGSSLSASNDPLIVINGMPLDNDGIKGVANFLSTINPNDIESFTILKDASATAIYGSRASNGVIIITTKRGEKNQKPRISYEGNTSLSVVGKTLDVLNGDEFRALVGDVFAEQNEVLAVLGAHNTDWQNQIFQHAFSQDHSVSITGGYKNIPYRASLGYTNQDGILKTSNFERMTASINMSPTFFDNHLSLNLNAKGMLAKNRYAETGAVGAAVAMDPTQPVFSDEEPFKTSFGGYWQWYNTIDNQVWFNNLAVRNPLATLLLKSDIANSNNIILNGDATYKFHFLPEMKAHVSLGTEKAFGKQDLLSPETSASDHNWGRTGSDEISKTREVLTSWLQYGNRINFHNFDVMGGYEWQRTYREGSSWFRGLNRFDSNEDGTIDETDQYKDEISNEWKSQKFLVSFFGRANYSFLDRYLFTATVRLDGSSHFAKENRWGTFPSFAFAWRMSEEDFISNLSFVSDMKLRLGYGLTGQQDIFQGDQPYLAVYERNVQGAYYPFGNTDGTLTYWNTFRPNAYNRKLKWEETSTWNAGLDFAFFRNRLVGSIDYYFRVTNDLLNVVDIPMGTNFSNRVISNIGSLQNNGIELDLTGRIIARKDFSWEVGFRASHNNNKITKLTTGTGEGYFVATGGISSGVGAHAQAHAVGHPAASFYVYKQIYDENGRPIEGEFADLYEDGIINSNDLYFHKKPAPDLVLGLSSRLVYKNFDFSFNVRSHIGNYMYNDVAARSHNLSDTGIFSTSGFFVNKPQSAFETNFTQNKSNTHLSDYYIQNASFVRVDNITLGYTFGKMFDVISSGRIYASVQNPFVFTGYKGLDPENAGGIGGDIFPRPIISLIGLSLQF